MASSWGNSFLTAWGDSWGATGAVTPVAEVPAGMPGWAKKRLVEEHLKHLSEEKRKAYIRRLALLLLGGE